MNERLKQLRLSLNLNQEEFGKWLGISKSGVSDIESGRRKVTDQHIIMLSSHNISEKWLRTGEGEMFVPRSVKDEIGYFVEDLLDYDGEGNPFYDMIIEMMKDYHDLDEKSKKVIRDYFKKGSDGMKKEKD